MYPETDPDFLVQQGAVDEPNRAIGITSRCRCRVVACPALKIFPRSTGSCGGAEEAALLQAHLQDLHGPLE